jgi:hypothetical protein
MLPYQVALRSMDKGTNWSMCCQMTIDEIANLEMTNYFGFQTIRGFNQYFQKLKLIPNSRASIKSFLGSNLFAIFPEACTMLLHWAR